MLAIIVLGFVSNLIDQTQISIVKQDTTIAVKCLIVFRLIELLIVLKQREPNRISFSLLFHAIGSQRILSQILTLLIPIPFDVLGFQAILVNTTKILILETIVSIITISVIESLIILTQRHALESMFLILFHGIFGSHSFLALRTSRTPLRLAKLNAVKTIFVNYFESAMAANATTMLLKTINSHGFAPNWLVLTNFDNVEANTANIESFLIRISIVITILIRVTIVAIVIWTTMIAVGEVALLLQQIHIMLFGQIAILQDISIVSAMLCIIVVNIMQVMRQIIM